VASVMLRWLRAGVPANHPWQNPFLEGLMLGGSIYSWSRIRYPCADASTRMVDGAEPLGSMQEPLEQHLCISSNE
jgi:hypothetical protein